MALVEALDTLGPRTTYRTLLNTVRSRVERTAQEQRPELDPVEPGGLGDALFLDGTVTPVAATFTMSRSSDGWEVDAGLVHGLRPPVGDEAYVLACTGPDGKPAGAVRVTAVRDRTGHGRADRVGTGRRGLLGGRWPTSRCRRPRCRWIRRPTTLPSAMVASVEDAVRTAIATAGPGGGPSPHVRLVAADRPHG